MATQLQRLAGITGFKVYDNIAYGRSGGIFFNAAYANMSIACTVSAFVKRETGADLIEVKAFLTENKKKYKATDAQYDGQSITVTLPSSTVLKAEKAAEFIQDFAQFLSANGYRSECAFCSNNENLGYTVQDGRIMEACPACHEKLENILTDMKQEREQTGSYLRGAIGAVVAGIIGIIPWVLIGLIGYIASISGLIMAYLSYKFYLLFKGKRGRGMLFIVILVLVVFTYLGVMISDGVSAINELGREGIQVDNVKFLTDMITAPFSPGIEITYIAPVQGTYYITGAEWAEITGPLWGDIGLGLLFAAIGSFVYLRRIRRESLGKDIEVTRLPNNADQ